MEWTEQQKQVIEERGSDILVSAAAGSGKTAVLVERIIQRVCDKDNPVDIDRILVVTFTRAAAREMRDRIFSALKEKEKENPFDERIRMQTILVHNASISTIHGFCQSLIRNHFHERGLDPSRRIADEGELVLLKNETIEALLEERYKSAEQDFLFLADTFAGRDKDGALVDAVLRLYEESLSYPYPKKWLKGLAGAYSPADINKLNEASWLKKLFTTVKDRLSAALDAAKRLLEELGYPNDPHPYSEAVLSDIAQIEKLLSCDSYEAVNKAFSSVSFVTLSRKKIPEEDPAIREAYKNKRDSIKKEISALSELCSKPLSDIFAEQTALKGRVEALSSLVIEFKDRFDRAKEKRGLLDFSDLEHFSLDILIDEETGKKTPCALSLSEYYAEVMVDEYQDSNNLQELLLSAVCRDGDGRHNYFMVGDVKQSIYRFRQANPEIFIHKYSKFGEEDQNEKRILLDRNFRSRYEVTESVNAVFREIMRPDMGGILYDKDQELKCGADYYKKAQKDEFKTELVIADYSKDEAEAFDTKEAWEAAVIARKIRMLMENGRCTDKKTGELRRINFSDIAILHRNANSIANTYQDTLKSYGIPTQIISVTGYFSAVEVETLLSLLRVIANPMQDVALAACMKSPMFSFTDGELAAIRLDFKDEPFYKAARLYAKAGDDKTRLFYEKIDSWREKADRLPIYELLVMILRETGYLAYVSALPGGDVRKKNIEKLLALSISFENTSYRGLFYFIRYIERMQKYELDMGQAGGVNAGDAVSIMTIHKSKGLEFPIVILAGLARSFTGRTESLALNSEYGIGLYNINIKKRTRQSTLFREFILRQNALEDMGEEQRVLYVAMTRAKEKLILVAAGSGISEAATDSADNYGALSRMHARSYFDWILPIALNRGDLFRTEITDLSDIVIEETAEQLRKTSLIINLKTEVDNQKKEWLDWCGEHIFFEYPHSPVKGLKAKYSVSEIKQLSLEKLFSEDDGSEELFLPKERESYIPQFISGKDISYAGARRGTAVHRFLECFDFTLENIEKSFEKEMERMLIEGRLKEKDAKLISAYKIKRFLGSELAARMHRAACLGKLKKEAAFVMMDQPSHFFDDERSISKEPVLVQGIIDAFFEEEDGIVLLDYKTDSVSDKEELIARYLKQMELYADALSRTRKKRIKEKYLYSFALGFAIVV